MLDGCSGVGFLPTVGLGLERVCASLSLSHVWGKRVCVCVGVFLGCSYEK